MLQPNKKYKKSQYNFTGCVTGLCKDLAEENKTNESSFRKKNNLYGDAWSMQPYGDNIDISKGYSNLKIGDVIHLSRAALPGDAKKNIPSANQHVGRVSKIVDGVPYIKHYVASGADRKYYEEPINNISQFKEYKPTTALRLDSYKDIKPNKPNLKFDKNYTPNNIELDMLKGDKDRASLQKKLSLTNEEYDRLSKMSYGVMGAETDNGRSMRSLYRMAVPDFIQKGIKVAGDVLKNRDTYDENINNLSQGYGSIKESSLHGISDNNPNYTKKTGLTANQRIRKGDYKDLERTNNYLHGAMSSIGVNPDNMENGANSYKGTLANLAFLKKRFPNASDTELLKKYTGKSDIGEYKKKYDSYINNIDGKSNNNKQYDWKQDVIGTLSDAANKYYDTTKNIKDAVVSTARDYIPGPLAIKAMLGDALGGKAPITNKTLSSAENKAMEKVANRVIKNNKNNTDYQSYFPNLSAKEASAVSGGNTNKSFNTIFNMLTPQGQLQNTLGQSSVKQKGKNVVVSDTYDFNDQGKSFGILDDIQKRGLNPYNVARAIGRNVGSMDGQGAPVKLVYKNTNKRADGGYMNNGINPKFNNYLNNGQHAFGGYVNPGDPSKFILGPNANPTIIPSQGSYPLSYRDRGDRDVDGVLFTQSKQVSRVDANGKPLTRNQIAENQKMWNMQKEAYSPQQQAFNTWKNNEENTMRGGYNPQEYYDMVAKFNSQPDVQLDGLNIKENYKRGETKGSCSTGQANRGESLRDNRAYGGWLDKYDDSSQYAEGGELNTSTKSWQDQQLAMKTERDQKLKNLLINRPQFKKTTLNDQVAEKLRQDRIVTTAKDATAVRNYNNADKHSNIARNKTDKEIIAERNANITKGNNAKLNQWSTDIVNPATWTRQNVADAAAGLGDKARLFPNDAHSFVDEYLNPGVMIGNMGKSLGEAPLQAKQSNSYLPYVTSIGAPLVAGALGGIGAKSTGQFVNNMINPLAGLNPELIKNIPSAFNIKGKLAKGLSNFEKSNFWKAFDEHTNGLERGLNDQRPFFEKFPITSSQKAKVYAKQDEALKEGKQFLMDWHYGDSQELNPDIVKKMQELDPSFSMDKLNNTSLSNTLPGPDMNPFHYKNDMLISTRRNILKNENISDEAKQYILDNRNSIGGVNMGNTNESITLRNQGLYHYPPSKIKEVVVHEGGHTAEKLGNPIAGYDANTNVITPSSIPFDNIKTFDEDFTDYYTANPNTEVGKLFKEAMVETTPHVKDASGNITKRGYKWEASPGELHAELLAARSNLVDEYVKQGYNLDKKDIISQIRNDVTDEQIDWMIHTKHLNRFFKETTSPELKRKVIRMLYAGVPAAVGLNAVTNTTSQHRQGGYLNQKQSSTNSWLNKYE